MRPLSWFSQNRRKYFDTNQNKLQSKTNENISNEGNLELTTYKIKPLDYLNDDHVMISKSYDKLNLTSHTMHSDIDLTVEMGRYSMSETDVRNVKQKRELTSDIQSASILSNSLYGGLVQISTENAVQAHQPEPDKDVTNIHRTTKEMFKSITFKNIFGTCSIIDKQICCNVLFQINIIVCMACVPGFVLFTTYLPHHLKDTGFSSQTAVLLLSVIGGLDLLNKIGLAEQANSGWMLSYNQWRNTHRYTKH